jgi:CRP-like cAMP-binding protein
MSVESTLERGLTTGWFLAGIPEPARRRLASIGGLTSVPRGATVIREGAAVDDLGVVVEGRLAVRLAVPGRGVVTVLTIEPGDWVGWSALVPPYRATSTIVALESTSIVTFPGWRLRAAMEDDPALAAALFRGVLEAVARRLAATRTQLLDLFARAEGEPW